MSSPGDRLRQVLTAVLWLATLSGAPSSSRAQDFARAERLFADHCAVCHGVDRGGYIGPALNRDQTKLSRDEVAVKILTGGGTTLMPQPPTWRSTLSADDRDLLASLITGRARQSVSWGIEDIRKSPEVFVADESTLPAKPTYRIGNLDDLMAVMARGRFAAGKEAKVVVFDGRTNRKVGEVPTRFAPHLMDFHPTQERWAYVRDDLGYIHKIDLHSLKVVRKVRAGLNGASLAVSRDGRYLAAGSYVPNAAVILDAATLEPLKLMALRGVDPDGKMVDSDSGMIIATSFAGYFVIALEQAGQVWIVDLSRPEMPITRIEGVGRHLHDGFLSPDGRHLVVSSYDDNVNVVIDLAGKRIVKKIPAGCQPHLGSGAVVRTHGRMPGMGTNIGGAPCDRHEVTVFDMTTFEVVRKLTVGDMLSHSHFPEYTARGDFLYVSARAGGDRPAGYHRDRLVIYDARTLNEVKAVPLEVPAGVFSHARARAVVVGLGNTAR